MKLTYTDILNNPDLLERVVAEAKRERILAINRLVFAPIAAFFHRPAKHKTAAALNIACG